VGRLAEPDDIVDAVTAALSPHDLAGVRVLVTAGPTREALDPVRFISNRSSGRMGFALARSAIHRGADVTLITGPTVAPPPPGAKVVVIETADELLHACLEAFDDCDVAVMNAAVADYRPAAVAADKMKKDELGETLALERTTDVAATLGRRKGERLVVAFAAETTDVIEHGRSKLASKHADLVVANRVAAEGTGFDHQRRRPHHRRRRRGAPSTEQGRPGRSRLRPRREDAGSPVD
jgi:phosphopantothenoylcysteine decarboxylase/phosphopantothenate--cysteine ligase